MADGTGGNCGSIVGGSNDGGNGGGNSFDNEDKGKSGNSSVINRSGNVDNSDCYAIGKSGSANYPFFAMLSRMKHINRWGLMRNTRGENIQEHSLQVAVIAHALALIRNMYFGGHVDADRAAVVAMFHDCDEILTGDLPTPVKYFNEGILNAYREVENAAKGKLLSMLPEEMRPGYCELFYHGSDNGASGSDNSRSGGRGNVNDVNDGSDNACSGGNGSEIWRIVKAADTISAYIKCLEEIAGGNTEFATAEKSTRRKIEAIGLPEVQKFMGDYIGAFSLTLDEYGI